MIAFTILWRPIYRYGLFYLITFVSGYAILRRLGKRKFFVSYPKVHYFLTKGLDDFMLVAIAGVIIGGRLGHVFLYERSYYVQNLDEIYMVRQWGMSFIGGVIGVTIGLFVLMRKHKISTNDLLLLGDIVLCIVPIGITLGRIGNYLNQELWGKPLEQLAESTQKIIQTLGATRVYTQVDGLERVNTNLLQSGGEGLLTLIVWRVFMKVKYFTWSIQPGLITGLFLVIYAIVRFVIEFLKELPATEFRWPLTVSQWIMFVFFVAGVLLIRRATLFSPR